MRGVSVNILFAFGAQAFAKDVLAKHIGDQPSSKLVDRVVSTLFVTPRVLAAWPFQKSDASCKGIKTGHRAADKMGRRAAAGLLGLLFGTGCSLFHSRNVEAASEGLLPLNDYLLALGKAQKQLDNVAEMLRNLDTDGQPSPQTCAELSAILHKNELGKFWRLSRGTDRYIVYQRSAFARSKKDEELWNFARDSGRLGSLLKPNFNNPDDPLCLVYSCVTDSRAPPSIDTLYALKLLDEGFTIGSRGGKVTAGGLLANVDDTSGKLAAYIELVRREADPSFADPSWVNLAPMEWGRSGI